MEQKDEILRLARRCLDMETSIRPEVEWLGKVYDRFRKKQGMLLKAQADQALYERLLGGYSGRSHGPVKIRFWRTGKHVPVNREQCRAFGMALELTEQEMSVLMQIYYDRSDTVFQEVPKEEDLFYWKRRKKMDELQREYLMKIRPEMFFRSNSNWESQKKNFRHLYYMDACKYTVFESQWYDKDRSASMSYHSELNRTLQLLGEIPRKTMIRHLIILCMPYLSRKRLNDYMKFFGYLPLTANHTQTGGEYLDWLLIHILDLYGECCSGKDPDICTEWFQRCCRILDGFFMEQGADGLRFMDFKTLKK